MVPCRQAQTFVLVFVFLVFLVLRVLVLLTIGAELRFCVLIGEIYYYILFGTFCFGHARIHSARTFCAFHLRVP